MVAFALLQRIQDGNPDLEESGHCPSSMLRHIQSDAKFIIFLTLTLVVVVLLQNSVAAIIQAFTESIFPQAPWSQSILQFVWALLLVPIISILSTFGRRPNSHGCTATSQSPRKEDT